MCRCENKTIPTLVLMVLLATAVKRFTDSSAMLPNHYDGDCFDKQLAADWYLRPNTYMLYCQ